MIGPVRVNPVLVHPDERRKSLSGSWGFQLDPEDIGARERWFDDISVLADRIEVPGCWQGQGFGGDGKDTVWDFGLQARTFRATCTGTGWYGREFDAPGEWNGLRVWLNFGGAHPSAEVWLNGVRLGENDLPFAPFGFEITDLVRFGAPNWLAVRVHERNRLLGLAFNWQGNWSGLYRGVELTGTGPALIERLWVHADVDRRAMRMRVRIGDPSGDPMVLRVSAQPIGVHGDPITAEVPIAAGEVEYDLPVPKPRLWSPDAPNLYRVEAVLVPGGGIHIPQTSDRDTYPGRSDGGPGRSWDALAERVGFVKLSTEGKHFLINGEPYYMRGTGDFISCPETGCPDTDRDRWRRKLAALREYGYNYVRCQSFVFAPEYFDAADEVGLLIQSEMGMLGAWGGHSIWHGYNWPKPTPDLRDALKRQWGLVVMRDVNHPSANIYCMSNECRPSTDFPRTAWRCYHDTKAIKPTAFVIWTDGGHQDDLPEDFVNDEAEREPESPKPLIQHEFRWWSSFPDVRIMDKYSGAVRPYAADIALEAARQHGIEHVLPLAAENSQRLQFIEAKVRMEACRRDNPRIAGICHFNAMDICPSPQGILDEFYERKYADGATWRETNGNTVILSSLGFDDRVLIPGDVLRVSFFVSDFSHPPLGRPALEWELSGDGSVIAAGRVNYDHQSYCTCPVGDIEVAMPDVSRPMSARLEVALREGDRVFANTWSLWVFPKNGADGPAHPCAGPNSPDIHVRKPSAPADRALGSAGNPARHMDVPGDRTDGTRHMDVPGDRIVLTDRLGSALVEFIRSGGRVILTASEGLVRPFPAKLGQITGHQYFITPPGNYPPYEDGHDGTIILDHPMLGDFPHEGFADLQFFRMIANSPPLDLEPLGLTGADPVIRVIHSYPVCRPLGYLVEASLGKGGLILSALNLDQSLPEAGYLLAQICEYAASERFRPAMELSEDAIGRVCRNW